MNKRLFFSILLMGCFVSSMLAQTQITEQQAIQIVKSHRTSTNPANFYIAEVDSIINDPRCPVNEPPSDEWASSNLSKWLVFVDEKPGAEWCHDCNYYYIPQICMNMDSIPLLGYSGNYPPSDLQLRLVDAQVTFDGLTLTRMERRSAGLLRGPSVNPEANDTHVILLSSFGEMYYSGIKRWNECAATYVILTQEYHIPSQNIHILMGPTSGNVAVSIQGDTIAMPRDLDGDGINENIIPATYTNLVNQLDSLARLFSENEVGHLFLYLASGISASNNPDPYVAIHLDDSYIYSTDFECHLDQMNPKTFSMFANGGNNLALINKMGTHNRVLMGSSQFVDDYQTGYPYSSLFYHWINAIAGFDVINPSQTINADLDSDGHISMYEAFTHTASNNMVLNPAIESDPQTFSNELAFDRIPMCDFIKVEQGTGLFRLGKNSPDICAKNSTDTTTDWHNGFLTCDIEDPINIKVRVRNVGDSNYLGSGRRLSLLVSDPQIPQHLFMRDGNHVETVDLDCNIPAGQYQDITFEWVPTEDFMYQLTATGGVLPVMFHTFLHQGRYYDTDETMYWGPNSFATTHKGQVTINPMSCASRLERVGTGGLAHYITVYGGNYPFTLIAPSNETYNIEIIGDSANSIGDAFTNTKIYLELSDAVYQSWQQGGALSSNVTHIGGSTSKKYRLSNLGGKFYNISHTVCELKLFCDLDHTLLGSIDQKFYVVLKNSNGDVLDASAVRIIYENEQPGGIIIHQMPEGNKTFTLTEVNVQESAQFEWFDGDMNKISDGRSIRVNSENVDNQCILKVTRQMSGREDYAIVNLDQTPHINSVYPIPFLNDVTVLLTSTSQNSFIRVISADNGLIIGDYQFDEGSESISINSSSWPAGRYLFSLFNNGTLVESVQVLK